MKRLNLLILVITMFFPTIILSSAKKEGKKKHNNTALIATTASVVLTAISTLAYFATFDVYQAQIFNKNPLRKLRFSQIRELEKRVVDKNCSNSAFKLYKVHSNFYQPKHFDTTKANYYLDQAISLGNKKAISIKTHRWPNGIKLYR